MAKHNCIWHIANNTLCIDGAEVPLIHSPQQNRIRKLYTDQDVNVKQGQACFVQSRLLYDSLSHQPADWITYVTNVGSRQLMPNSVLADDSRACIQLVNPTDKPSRTLLCTLLANMHQTKVVMHRWQRRHPLPP